MTAIEAAITYLDGDTPLVTDVAYLHLHPIPNELYISAMSESGTCFYLREIDGGGAEFATDPPAASPTPRSTPGTPGSPPALPAAGAGIRHARPPSAPEGRAPCPPRGIDPS